MTKETPLSSSVKRRKPLQPPRPALDFALSRLGQRAYSEGELGLKLERAGYSALEIAEVLASLRAKGYLDDLAFAGAFARARSEGKRWGPRRIAQALRQRGVSQRLIQQVLAEAFPRGEDEPLEKALRRFERGERARGSAGERKARAYRHLVARGFSRRAVLKTLERRRRAEETGEA